MIKSLAEHTNFDFPRWEPMHLAVNGFIGDRNVTPSDVQDRLCGHTNVPIYMKDRIQAASQRAAKAFYETVVDILSCNEPNVRLAETDAKAAPND